MGFFKSIGKAIKKNVSFKNLVKVATPVLGMVPFAGGALQSISESAQASHEAKKQAENAQNEYDRQVLEQQAQALQQQAYQTTGKMVGAIAGAGGQIFTQAVTEGAYAGISTGAKNGLGIAGAEIADSTIVAWFKKHWKHILIGLSVVGVIYLINKHNKPKKRVSRR
ncbi:hypothetical protein [Flavobacterium chilense]|uniref:Uncharacterized protein n=1 Tax=Flavobacterium chilense TaxID=946677 RepID=A0A1M7AC06_9FLAO|nr:hypothetical protein [Flavobacterium chilense]SHL40210.1 hypothetical protein SAMN05444484_1011372 [Flavobacterium chilense]